MFNIFAHASHDMESMNEMTTWDHCLPIIIAASLIVAFLLGVIIYMLVTWQPKSFTAPKKSAVSAKKKSSK